MKWKRCLKPGVSTPTPWKNLGRALVLYAGDGHKSLFKTMHALGLERVVFECPYEALAFLHMLIDIDRQLAQAVHITPVFIVIPSENLCVGHRQSHIIGFLHPTLG